MQKLSLLLQTAWRHPWIVLLVFTVCLWAFPIGYTSCRVFLIAAVAVLWAWGAYLLRRRRLAAAMVVVVGISGLAWLALPGRPGDPAVLRASYIQCLKHYEGTPYTWGGENRIAIDCSGLVREGLINANIKTGLVSLNPQLLRTAFGLWWHDCSAKALRDQYRGFTVQCGKAESINALSLPSLAPGDLAVTADGVHVLAYLGERTWIEADPGVMKVLTVHVPSDNVWFNVPVQIVRWNQLQDGSGQAGQVPSLAKPDR